MVRDEYSQIRVEIKGRAFHQTLFARAHVSKKSDDATLYIIIAVVAFVVFMVVVVGLVWCHRRDASHQQEINSRLSGGGFHANRAYTGGGMGINTMSRPEAALYDAAPERIESSSFLQDDDDVGDAAYATVDEVNETKSAAQLYETINEQEGSSA